MKINGYYFKDEFFYDEEKIELKIINYTNREDITITPNTREDKANALLYFCYENFALIQLDTNEGQEEDWEYLVSYGQKTKDGLNDWYILNCFEFIDNSDENQSFTLPQDPILFQRDLSSNSIKSIIVGDYNISKHNNGFVYLETYSQDGAYIALPKEFGIVYAKTDGVTFANIYANNNINIL